MKNGGANLNLNLNRTSVLAFIASLGEENRTSRAIEAMGTKIPLAGSGSYAVEDLIGLGQFLKRMGDAVLEEASEVEGWEGSK